MDMARRKKMVTFAVEPEILKKLEDWIKAQPVPPSKTAVFETALKRFLGDDGDQPPKT